jgi:hypothetical protein
MRRINYIFRVPFASLIGGIACLIMLILIAFESIFVNWDEGMKDMRDIPSGFMSFVKDVGGLK